MISGPEAEGWGGWLSLALIGHTPRGPGSVPTVPTARRPLLLRRASILTSRRAHTPQGILLQSFDRKGKRGLSSGPGGRRQPRTGRLTRIRHPLGGGTGPDAELTTGGHWTSSEDPERLCQMLTGVRDAVRTLPWRLEGLRAKVSQQRAEQAGPSLQGL